jgi:hypothetical protein
MPETILKLLLDLLPPLAAIPLAIVGIGLFASLAGKAKSFFDHAITWQNLKAGPAKLTDWIVIVHSLLGAISALWFYSQTDLASPSVSPDLIHPLGRSLGRISDWLPVFASAVLPSLLTLALSLEHPRMRVTLRIFGVTILLVVIFVFAVAAIRPALLTDFASLSPWTLAGFLWWYAKVALLAGPLGLAFALVGLISCLRISKR